MITETLIQSGISLISMETTTAEQIWFRDRQSSRLWSLSSCWETLNSCFLPETSENEGGSPVLEHLERNSAAWTSMETRLWSNQGNFRGTSPRTTRRVTYVYGREPASSWRTRNLLILWQISCLHNKRVLTTVLVRISDSVFYIEIRL